MLELINKINEKYIIRFAILSICVFYAGMSSDINWHWVNAIRDHYFIVPHIIIYLGITSLLFCFFILKIKNANLPLWLFVFFPIFSVFDDFWHKFYGIELSTSPMMYWSPAHSPVGMIMLYIIYKILALKIEDNKYILLFMKTLLFVQSISIVYMLLTPLSPFSIYANLHTDFNILASIFSVLVIFSIYKVFKDKDILLPSLFLFCSLFANQNFLFPSDFVYGNFKIFLIFYSIVFSFMLFDKLSLKYYLFAGYLTLFFSFLFTYIVTTQFSIIYFIFSTFISSAFAVLYFYVEDFSLKYFLN